MLSCSRSPAGRIWQHVVGGALLLLWAAAMGVSAHPLCLDLSVPKKPSSPLTFCTEPAYSTYGCCSPEDDLDIASAFQVLKVEDGPCSAALRNLYCLQCDPYSAQLFGVESKLTTAHAISATSFTPPFLCPPLLSSPPNASTCADVYDKCGTVSVYNSPYARKANYAPYFRNPLKPTVLDSYYPNATVFCAQNEPRTSVGDLCYAGTAYNVPPPSSQLATAGPGICLEQISAESFSSFTPHPDGSSRGFAATREGKIYLVNIPAEGSTAAISISTGSKPFLDLSGVVNSFSDMGFESLAFHPNFQTNGQLYVAYMCDSSTIPSRCGDFAIPCPCTSGVECTEGGRRIARCRNAFVVAEYRVAGDTPLRASRALPTENRRILTYGQPFSKYRGGQIRFGAADGLLYIQLGDGGEGAANFVSQNLQVLLGKVVRIDVTDRPAATGGSTQTLYGQYSIPGSNPFYGLWKEGQARGEIYALGLRDPQSCSFDSARPTYFYCGDVDQSGAGEINLVGKGGNYGWNNSVQAPNDVVTVPSVEGPILTYPQDGATAVIGGFVSRHPKDPCLYGRYLFNDNSGNFFAGTENPDFSGKFTLASLTPQCATDSLIPCAGNLSTIASSFTAWGEANNRDLYLLSTNGLFRTATPSRCPQGCTQVLSPPSPPPSPPSPPIFPPPPAPSSPPPPSPPPPASPPPPPAPPAPPAPIFNASLAPGEDPLDYGPSGKTEDYWLKTGIVLSLIFVVVMGTICGCCVMGYHRYRIVEDKPPVYETEMAYRDQGTLSTDYEPSDYEMDAEGSYASQPSQQGVRRVYSFRE